MFLTFASIVLFLQGPASGANAISATPTINNNNAFVKILKEDLRRNNDDYLAIDKIRNLTGTNTKGENEIKLKFDETNKLYNKKGNNSNSNTVKESNRRVYDIVSDGNLFNETGRATPRRFLKVTAPKYEPSEQAKYKNLTSGYPKHINKEKVEKLMKFLDKNKGLVKDFIRNKKAEAQTEAMRAVEESQSRESDLGEMVRQVSGKGRNDHLPGANQLDMAPAKGGRIHALRVRNRLCHRHVMVPEGPKYDSKGKVYLKEYSPVYGRNYEQTRPPRLVLPKCCNCCKKSVLGCE